MKKSKLINVLIDYLNVAGVKSNYCDSDNEHKIIAETILDCCEKAGMVPCYYDGGYFGCDECGCGMEHEWEDEDVD